MNKYAVKLNDAQLKNMSKQKSHLSLRFPLCFDVAIYFFLKNCTQKYPHIHARSSKNILFDALISINIEYVQFSQCGHYLLTPIPDCRPF